MSAPLRVLIIGATGRMGRALVRALREADLCLAAALTHPGSSHLGRDAGELAGCGPVGVPVTSDLAALARCDVALDFSHSPAAASNLAACCAAGKPLLIGTTGLPDLTADVERAARHIPLLVAANTSLGVTLLLELVRQAAEVLPRTFDVEILEAHHRGKKDAPSGTALALGRVAAQAQGKKLEAATDRAGARREGDIGFAVIRGGDIVGEHTVIFAGTGEQLSLSHRITDRQIFARGALQAAIWLAGKPAGQYTMRDVVL